MHPALKWQPDFPVGPFFLFLNFYSNLKLSQRQTSVLVYGYVQFLQNQPAGLQSAFFIPQRLQVL
jgi:hypothetical protein